MTNTIAVLNAGSSSIKFAIYEASGEQRLFFRGQVEGIGVKPHLKLVDTAGAVVEERSFESEGFDHDTATREIVKIGHALLEYGSVVAFGHRVVHGGINYAAPVRVSEAILDDLAKLEPLAPLHQPHNLAPIREIMKAAPQNSADRLLRHGFPPHSVQSGSGVRPAAALQRGGRPPLRVPRPIL